MLKLGKVKININNTKENINWLVKQAFIKNCFFLSIIEAKNIQPKGYPTTAQLEFALENVAKNKTKIIGIKKFKNTTFCITFIFLKFIIFLKVKTNGIIPKIKIWLEKKNMAECIFN